MLHWVCEHCRHGAEVVEPQGGEKARAFVGTGYKLGQSSNDTEVVAGASRRHSHAEMVLKLWREGFSINNGELRAYSDPANRELLDYVRRGYEYILYHRFQPVTNHLICDS